MATVVTAVHLPRKYFRAQVRKEKRKKKRQAAAQLRDAQRTANESEDDDDNQDVEEKEVETEQGQGEQDEERSSLQARAAWLERESLAQAEFEKQRKIAEAIKQKEMEERKLIQKEWEEQQKKEEEEKEKKDQELESVLQQLDHELGNKKESSKGSKEWRNPEAPAASQPASNQPGRAEKKEEICSFFLKTGACRFKERCSRTHPYPEQGTTLMIPGMYTNFGLGPDFKDEYDADVGLECDEESAYLNFLEFYEDVLPEFREYGEVVQLKVCRNWEPHLRGNVYVQYRNEEEAAKAAQVFAGRFYGGKQLDPRYCPVTRWKPAICGLFHRDKCPRGKHCNFLHVFHNPRGEFSDADQDRPPRTSRHRHDDQRRRGDRQAREFRRRSRSRSRSRLDYRRSRRRSRSKSRERSSRRYSHRRSRSRERAIRRSRSRSRDRSYRSRSRERTRRRSSSPDRNGRRIRDQRRDRSRSSSGEDTDRKSRSGSRERQLPDCSTRKSKDRKYDHNRSRSRSRERSRKRRRSSLEDNDVTSIVKKERRIRSRSRERTTDKGRSRIKERGKKNRSSSVEQDSDGSQSHSGSDHEPSKPKLSIPLNSNGSRKEEGSPLQDFKDDRWVESSSFKDEEKCDVSNDKSVPIDSKLTSAVHRKKKGKSKKKSRHKRHSSSERKKKRRRHQKSESSSSSSAEEGEKEDLTVKEKEMRERIQKRHQSGANPKACDIETGEGQSNDSSDDEALRLAAMRTMGQKKLNR